jgi:hypothetical protein
MEQHGLVLCPECNGRKMGVVHLNTTNGGRWENRKCDFCDGFGHVRRHQLDKWRECEAMRIDRKARGMTLRAEAARLGISPSELSDREWGRSSGR